jgi:hypothetical protein
LAGGVDDWLLSRLGMMEIPKPAIERVEVITKR